MEVINFLALMINSMAKISNVNSKVLIKVSTNKLQPNYTFVANVVVKIIVVVIASTIDVGFKVFLIYDKVDFAVHIIKIRVSNVHISKANKSFLTKVKVYSNWHFNFNQINHF